MPGFDLSKLKNLKIDKSKKETLIFITAFFVVIIVLYFQIFLKSAISELFTLLPELRKLRADINRTKEDMGYEAILKKKLIKMEEEINVYEKKLPASQEIPLILEELSGMAKDSYVKIVGINPKKSPRAGKADSKSSKIYQEIPITVSAKSGYHQLGVFINRLENADRFMEVSDISIKADNADFKRHKVDLIVSTYVLLNK